jgi:chorismate synthase
MATESVTAEQAVQERRIAGMTHPHEDDADSRLAIALGHLDAATAMVCGDGFEVFDSLNSDLQHEYLFMLRELARKARFAHNDAGIEREQQRATA